MRPRESDEGIAMPELLLRFGGDLSVYSQDVCREAINVCHVVLAKIGLGLLISVLRAAYVVSFGLDVLVIEEVAVNLTLEEISSVEASCQSLPLPAMSAL